MNAVLHAEALRFQWPGAAGPCLDIPHFEVGAGESVFLFGPSGCGKSTLLSLCAGILTAGPGQVRLLGLDWTGLSSAQRDRHRASHVGYIFQQFNLLPYLDVLDNVLLPCRFSPRRAGQGSIERARALLARMDIDAALWRRPALSLSVGQQQRVAAARALIGGPELIIADEPTSALDDDRRDAFLDVLLEACRSGGSALVFVSHDRRMAGRFNRSVSLPSINLAGCEAAA